MRNASPSEGGYTPIEKLVIRAKINYIKSTHKISEKEWRALIGYGSAVSKANSSGLIRKEALVIRVYEKTNGSINEHISESLLNQWKKERSSSS